MNGRFFPIISCPVCGEKDNMDLMGDMFKSITYPKEEGCIVSMMAICRSCSGIAFFSVSELNRLMKDLKDHYYMWG
jgi:C4-type Zn-finger protein